MSASSRRRAPVGATNRLKQDYLRIMRDPVPYILAQPLPSNILEWHYCVKGPEDSPYSGGYYHGKLVFPSEYPFLPPKIMMITPNGRFQTGVRLCLSISDFHPDTWNPAWSVSTILTGLLSFMLEDTPTLGSVSTTRQHKRMLARESGAFNLRNSTFTELFPDLLKEIQEQRSAQQQQVDTNGISSEETEKRSASSPPQSPGSIAGNLVVIVVIVAFAWTVHYVLSNSAA